MTRRANAVRVGLAGWSNPPDAKQLRLPEQSHLEYYAEWFNCVEINSSFYRSHRPATYRGWARQTGRSFRFSVKMPRTITHESGLRGCRRDLGEFFAAIAQLGSRLGVVLIQLPPALAFDARIARRFFRSLPVLGEAYYACEPRHASWFEPAADGLLDRLGVARVAADPPRAHGADIPGGDRARAYFRWHGQPRLYYSSYAPDVLEGFACQVRTAARGAWCIFDNTAQGAAWTNAQSFDEHLAKPVDRPVRGAGSRQGSLTPSSSIERSSSPASR